MQQLVLILAHSPVDFASPVFIVIGHQTVVHSINGDEIIKSAEARLQAMGIFHTTATHYKSDLLVLHHDDFFMRHISFSLYSLNFFVLTDL